MRKKTLLTLVFLSLAIATALAANKFTLVIDAGHGGHDSGAPGAISKEKDINLKVALAFGKMVERNCHDVKVIYTRTTDVFIPLSERANIANRNKADLFISVHTNALDGGKISRGFETYTLGMHRANDNLNVAKRENSVILIEKDYKQRYAGFDPKSSESYIMFELMQDKNMAKSVDLAKLIQSEVCAVSGRVNKGVHQAGFLVLRETSMPSCLIELGFITTPDEEQFLNSADGQNLMAKGIYNAFLKYKKQHGSTKIAADGASDASDNAPVLAQQTTPVTPAPAPKPSTTPKPSTSTSTPSSATPKAPSTPKPSSTTESSSSTAHPVATRPFVEDDTTSVTQFAEQRSVRKLPTTSTASPPPATPAPPPPTTTAAAPHPATPAPPPPATTAAAPRPATPAPPPPATTAAAPRPATPAPQPPTPTATVPRPATPAPQPPATTAAAPRPATPAPPPTPIPSSDTVRVTATIPPPPTPPTPVTSQQPIAQDSPSVPPPTPVAPPLEAGGRPIFKVQIAANSLQLPVDDAVFKGLQGVDMYVENDLYKYTVGATPDFEEISQLRKTVSELFPQAFIIAFRDGIKIPLAQAIKEYRNAKQTK